MRTLAIGDIHGCSIAFDTLMEAIQLKPTDRLITLGDYIDRGPDARGIIDSLIGLHDRGQLIAALRGNHEIMMLEARRYSHRLEGWLSCGGRETLASYATSPKTRGRIEDVPDEHWHFIDEICRDWWETENHFYVHGNVNPNKPLSQQSSQDLFWTRFYHAQPHYSGKTMICGHTRQKNGHPISLGYAICIDTWVYGKGWLTCLDINSGQIWQANQKGQQRTAWIEDYSTSCAISS
ncbi:MAG: metallophosphoesterase family protein [Cyanobacteriota bacterium]|nr:metallophosphoesterase family protein [Cyanobacteriota bacterium]